MGFLRYPDTRGIRNSCAELVDIDPGTVYDLFMGNDNNTNLVDRVRATAWMTPWERHCAKHGLDEDDLIARDEYLEACYEDQRWPDL